jgi:hypothetical protein
MNARNARLLSSGRKLFRSDGCTSPDYQSTRYSMDASETAF